MGVLHLPSPICIYKYPIFDEVGDDTLVKQNSIDAPLYTFTQSLLFIDSVIFRSIFLTLLMLNIIE